MEKVCEPCTKPKISQVTSELTRTLNNVDALLDYVEQLRSSISPVLRDIEFPGEDIDKDSSSLVPLARNICDIGNRISLANIILSEMLENLEL